MAWQETLADIFEGYVNQETFEVGVQNMVFVSSDDPEWHHLFLAAIESGLKANAVESDLVRNIINKSGYRVSTSDEAARMLLELQHLYLQAFENRK